MMSTVTNNGTITVGPIGSNSTQIYGTNGTNGANATSWASVSTATPKVHIDEIILKGQSLNERLEKIEILLNIPIRDVKMEKLDKKLKQLNEEYMERLACLKTWYAIKESK